MTSAEASERSDVLQTFETLALAAGRRIMDVFHGAMEVMHKSDASPVTEADRASEEVILAGLRETFPEIPCVAEEEAAAGLLPDLKGTTFFLIDPLDGTKEFVQRKTDFTVNIALIADGVPVAGVVYSPCSGLIFGGAGRFAEMGEVCDGMIVNRQRIHVRDGAEPLTVVASRSHIDEMTTKYIAALGAAEIVSVGSSVKFCMVAQAKADLYPRFGRTMEWDTAAGDAVLRAAGGMTVTLDGRPLTYGKTSGAFENPSFIAHGRLAVLPL